MATLTLEHLYRNGEPTVKVGDGATLLLYSDSHAGTVIKVSASGKTIHVQRDTATRTDSRGMSECQEYTYAPDPNGPVTVYRFSARSGWINRNASASRCLVGLRRAYHDFTF